MDDRNVRAEGPSPPNMVELSYVGEAALPEALLLHDELETRLRQALPQPTQQSTGIASLGVPEIILTLFLAAALRTTVLSILNHLEAYFSSRMEDMPPLKVKLIFHGPKNSELGRFVFRIDRERVYNKMFSAMRALVDEA